MTKPDPIRLRSAALLGLLAVPALAQVLVNGAGATFPYPIYAVWFDQFHRRNPGALINYQPVGSRVGVRQLEAGVLDFGATDMPLSDAELSAAGVPIRHFPTVIGAVVPIYNLPGFKGELNFSADAIAGIFMGEVTRWNDPRLAQPNPGARLPDAAIVPVHRSDGSGTTFILSDYLSKASPQWKAAQGAAASIAWRAGIGARGSEGVAGIVKQTPYAFGYVELVYASQNRIAYGAVRNAAGRFVKADAAAMRAAAASAADSMPDDFRVSIANPPGKNAYPIASYTWLLAPARIADPVKRKVIVEFLRWMLREGQETAKAAGYAPLPRQVAARALKACDGM
jgi:phosphate transport system substrate-binding protein